MARRIGIWVDSPCNNNCIYCFSKKGRKGSEFRTQVQKAVRERMDGIAILGGEPTMREDIQDMVSFASNAGFKRITIMTNARPLSKKEFAEALIEKGVSDFVVKLWGPTREVHDAITRSDKSFEETVEGIKNIVTILGSEAILGKTAILQENYKYLPDLVKVYTDLGVKWMNFELPFVEENPVPLTPEVMEYIYKSIDGANNWGTYLGIENIPFCSMEGYEDYVRPFALRKENLEDCNYLDFVYPLHDENKRKTLQCNPCRYNPVCDGIWKTYIEQNYVTLKPIEVIEKKRPFEKISDLKGKEELFHPLVKNVIPDGLRADALVHFSGGTDSTVSTALYARKYPDKKVVLITYRHPGMLNISSSRINGAYLMEKYSNVIAHVYVDLLEELYIPLCFGRDYKEQVTKVQANYGCVACKILMYAYSTYLHTVYFKGDTILSGNNLTRVPGRGGPPTPQTPTVMALIKDFVSNYNMNCVNPIYSITNKQRVVFLARELGLPTMRAFQSTCTYGCPVPLKDIDAFVQFIREEISPIVKKVLDSNLKKVIQE